MEDVAAGMMAPLWLHWYTKGAVPEAEHLSVVEVLSCTVFEVSPESVMRTSEGGAARNMHMNAKQEKILGKVIVAFMNSYLYPLVKSLTNNKESSACIYIYIYIYIYIFIAGYIIIIIMNLLLLFTMFTESSCYIR